MGMGSTMVAVRSIRLGEPMVDEEDEGRRYHQVDFTMVDLDTGEMYLKFLPSLYSCMGKGNMVKLGESASTLYVIGGARHPFEMSEKLLKLKEEKHKHPGYYMGACRAVSGRGWQHIDLPNNKHNYTCLRGAVTAMMGRIYCFGHPGIRPEVYNPLLDKWEFLSTASLPEELLNSSDTRVIEPVVPDPQNNRILLHLTGGSGDYLYAFYPNSDRDADPTKDGGEWECLSDEFYIWYYVAAVVDNVLYFHEFGFPSLLRAYDLNTHEWLAVVWSTLEVDNVYLGYVQFSGLFDVGQGVLCLAFWGRSVGDRDCPLEFFKFTVRRTSASVLHLTPLSLKCFAIPCTKTIFDLIPLKDGLLMSGELEG